MAERPVALAVKRAVVGNPDSAVFLNHLTRLFTRAERMIAL